MPDYRIEYSTLYKGSVLRHHKTLLLKNCTDEINAVQRIERILRKKYKRDIKIIIFSVSQTNLLKFIGDLVDKYC